MDVPPHQAAVDGAAAAPPPASTSPPVAAEAGSRAQTRPASPDGGGDKATVLVFSSCTMQDAHPHPPPPTHPPAGPPHRANSHASGAGAGGWWDGEGPPAETGAAAGGGGGGAAGAGAANAAPSPPGLHTLVAPGTSGGGGSGGGGTAVHAPAAGNNNPTTTPAAASCHGLTPPPCAPPSAVYGDLPDFLRSLSWWWRAEDPAAQAYAARRLQAAALDPGHAATLASTTGALRFLVHTMQLDYSPGREPAKAAAARALANVAFHGPEARRAVGGAGAVPAAIALLAAADDPAREAAAGLLANLAADPALLVDAASRGAPAALVSILRSGTAGGVEEALAFLFLDAARGPDRAGFLASLGVLPLAVRSLTRVALTPRGVWLVGLLWSAAIPSPDRTVQHELAKVTPLLVHMAAGAARGSGCGRSAPSSANGGAGGADGTDHHHHADGAAGSGAATPAPPGADTAADAAAVLLSEYTTAGEANALHAKRAGAEPLFSAIHAARPAGTPVWGAALGALLALGGEDPYPE